MLSRMIKNLAASIAALRVSYWRTGAWFAALGCALAMISTGAGFSLEEQFRIFRDGFRARPASGQVHIIEIDAKSIATLQSWPWSRQLHGELLDKLDAAGVTMVAFDVDFSSPSQPEGDLAFAKAIRNFNGTVVLPTFRQAASGTTVNQVENLPIKPLAAHSFLGSVNVFPDPDGQMRNYSYGTVTNGIARPSLGAIISGAANEVNAQFRIDSAVEPATIPRHSFADVLAGRVTRADLANANIVVGATAIELGDRYATPRHGVLPGVVIQAMAAETLIAGSMNPSAGPWPLLLLTAMIGWQQRKLRKTPRRVATALVTFAIIMIVSFVAEARHVASFSVMPAMMMGFVLLAALETIDLVRRFQRSRLVDSETELPNERALLLRRDISGRVVMVVAHLRQFGEITSVLSADDRTALIVRASDRLTLGADGTQIHLLGAGILGWARAGEIDDHTIEQVDALARLFGGAIEVGGRNLLITPAFGVASGDASDLSRLVSRARLASERAAASGQRWMIHNSSLETETDRALLLMADIDAALASGDIWAAYQPKWSAQEQRIAGSEALVRWRHPVLGPIPPDEFIPLLEANDKLRELTLMMLSQCLDDLAGWTALGLDIGVAVNISAPLLDDPQFVEQIAERIIAAPVAGSKLTLEVTESATVSSAEAVIAALNRLRTLGLRVSIDDYGTGQSTLTYLKSFPADELKIDKSFISRMLESQGDQAMVRSTIALAHELGFKVVAEGVEDGECLEKLVEFGCDTMQGWHIGKPVPIADFIALAQSQIVQQRAA